MADRSSIAGAPDLSRSRIFVPVRASAWLSPLAPRTRYSLRGDAHAFAAAGAAFGVALPAQACRAQTEGQRAALWLGPDERLLLAPQAEAAALASALGTALADIAHSLVDVSHRQVGLEISGVNAEDILNGACPLDLSLPAFPVGMCTRTVFEKADIVLWRTREDAFEIEVWRSFTEYVASLLGEIAREYVPG